MLVANNNMKNKILKSVGVVLLMIVVVFMYRMLSYGVTQEYTGVAAQQVSDDSAYYMLNARQSIISMYNIIFAIVEVGVLSLLYFIWRVKK